MMSSWRVTSRTGLLSAVVLLALAIVLAGVLPVLPGLSPDKALGALPVPKVVSVVPAANANNIPITQNISVTFSEDMDPATINAGSISIKVDTGFALPAKVTYDAVTKTATLDPNADLLAGKTYFVTVGTSAKSTAGVGVEGAPYTWYFRTVANTPPRVVSKTPAEGAVNVPLNQVISITFDSPMRASTFTQFSFYMAKRGGAVMPATIAYDDATMTATLTPTKELEEASTYDVTLIGTATGANGMFTYGAPIMWSFNTVLVQPPAVATKSPAPGATDVPRDTMITVTFDRAMDAATVTTDTFFIQKVGGPKVDCVMTANENGTTLSPKSKLEPGTTYQVTLTSDIKSAKGATLIGAPVTWQFITKQVTSPYSDVSTTYKYFAAIYELSQRNIIGGYPNGTFRPSNTVTREQFAKMIVKALGLTVTGSEICPFGDVPDQEGTDPLYPAKYIAVGAEKGIMQGKSAKIFAPYDDVTRYQAVTMVVRAADSVDRGLLKTPPSDYASTWNPALSATHGANARLAEYNGLLAGLPVSSLNPAAAMTRGEIAQLLWNLVQLLNK
jgi:hypothetical protein